MKITKEKYLFIILIIFIINSCSKNSDDHEEALTIEQGYFPKTISLVYDENNKADFEFFYTSKNQISKIETTRKSDDELFHLQTDFIYNEKGLIREIQTTNIDNATAYNLKFTYNDTIISDINWIIDEEEYPITFLSNPEQNIYGVDGELGTLPASWQFDGDNNVTEMYISTTHIVIETSNNDRGIFADVKLQPAIQIWNGLLNSLAPFELYFFNKTDIKNITTGLNTLSYSNKVRDSNGNLITFNIKSGLSLNIKNTVQYEARKL